MIFDEIIIFKSYFVWYKMSAGNFLINSLIELSRRYILHYLVFETALGSHVIMGLSFSSAFPEAFLRVFCFEHFFTQTCILKNFNQYDFCSSDFALFNKKKISISYAENMV